MAITSDTLLSVLVINTHLLNVTLSSKLYPLGNVSKSYNWFKLSYSLVFYGHFCAHGRLNRPSDLQR